MRYVINTDSCWSVWVGGIEDTENVTIDLALDIAREWQQQGYEDVVIENTGDTV